MKLRHFVHKMKKNTLKDGIDAKKNAKRDAKSSFCCSGSVSSPMEKYNTRGLYWDECI